jgi:hypothetical protein
LETICKYPKIIYSLIIFFNHETNAKTGPFLTAPKATVLPLFLVLFGPLNVGNLWITKNNNLPGYI